MKPLTDLTYKMSTYRYALPLLLLFTSIFACSTPPARIPDQAEQDNLVKKNLLLFSKAVMSNDFREFHSSLSTPFKTQYSAEDLQKIFHAFIDQKIDLAPSVP